MKKYQVIGGQYEYHFEGESDTLEGARKIAAENREYWDNWGGWHTPKIYLEEDVEEITAEDYITHPDGSKIRVPKEDAVDVETLIMAGFF